MRTLGYPMGCPQRWTDVDSVDAPTAGGSCRYGTGDRRRQIEKLSPGMCTGWGDLVPAGSPGVRESSDAASAPETLDRPSDLRLCPSARPTAAAAAGPPDATVHTAWGSDRDRQGTAGGRRPPPVNNRRDVHVSTTGRLSPPTIGQQGHSGPDQREEARSPASTRVMTRMRELSRRILEPHSGWGSSVPRCPGALQRATDAPPSEAGIGGPGGARPAHRGTGVSPRGTAAGTMSTAPAPDARRPGCRSMDRRTRQRAPTLSWGGSRDEVPGGT